MVRCTKRRSSFSLPLNWIERVLYAPMRPKRTQDCAAVFCAANTLFEARCGVMTQVRQTSDSFLYHGRPGMVDQLQSQEGSAHTSC